MSMLILIVACAVLLVENVASQGENSVKTGTFPFMAFLYYPDQVIDDGKFIQGAVLIRQDWLISSALDNKNLSIAFPEKTLLARTGAIGIDSKLNLNEDEDEQEREVIRIVHPSNTPNDTKLYDISLLKTLFPFNITLAVQPVGVISSRPTFGENCLILFYAKRIENTTEERILTQMSVDLLPSSVESCGKHFRNNSMICATSVEGKNSYMDSDYCQDYSGGPLICGSELSGIQIYIHSCKQPYLYQLLSAWDDLILCATEEKCQEEQCSNICLTTNKDPTESSTLKVLANEEIKLEVGLNNNEALTELIITHTTTTTEKTKASETTTTTPTTIIIEEEISTKTTMAKLVSNIFEDTTSQPNESEASDVETVGSVEEDTKYSELNVERKTNVEAQQHGTAHTGASINTLPSFNYFMYTLFVLMCIT